jgi:hypothetical protein
VNRPRLAGAAALFLLLVLALALGASAPPRERAAALERFPSSLNPTRRGLAAAAAWLEATGRPALRRETPDDPAPAGPAVTLLVAPAATLDPAEADALLAATARGGLLVWALGEAPQPALGQRLGVALRPGAGERVVAGQPGQPLLAGLALRAAGAAVEATRPGAAVAAGPADRPAALLRPVGRGEALILAGPELLDNARIGDLDALSLWVRLAGRGTVVFDERWLMPRAAPAPGGALGLLQALLVAALILAALAPRLGPPRARPAAGARPGARDYLASLAALYLRAGAQPALAADGWRRLRRRLERRTGIPARLPTEEAARRLARRAPAAAEALRRGEAVLASAGPGPLLEVMRAAAEVEAALDRPAPGAASFDTTAGGR